MKTKAKTFSAGEFKAKCLQVLDHLDREGLIVTKRGKPVARVIPIPFVDNRKPIGSMRGKVIVKGDIFSTDVKWDALPSPRRDRKIGKSRTVPLARDV